MRFGNISGKFILIEQNSQPCGAGCFAFSREGGNNGRQYLPELASCAECGRVGKILWLLLAASPPGDVLFWWQKRTRKPPAISTRWTHEKGAARPFQPQRRSRSGKMRAASLNAFFFRFSDLESLRDGRYGQVHSLSAARQPQADSSRYRCPKRSPAGSCRAATERPSNGGTQKSVKRLSSTLRKEDCKTKKSRKPKLPGIFWR